MEPDLRRDDSTLAAPADGEWNKEQRQQPDHHEGVQDRREHD